LTLLASLVKPPELEVPPAPAAVLVATELAPDSEL